MTTQTTTATTTKPVWKIVVENAFHWAEYLGTGDRDEAVRAAEADMQDSAEEELDMGAHLHGEEQDPRDYEYKAGLVEKVEDLADLTEQDRLALAKADPVVFRDGGGNG